MSCLDGLERFLAAVNGVVALLLRVGWVVVGVGERCGLDLQTRASYPSTMSSAARTLVSEAEFLALPETTQRVELVDGEVVVAPSPTLRHQEVLARLVAALREWAAERGVTVVQTPMDVRFGADRILQPDAMVFLQRLPMDAETPLDVVPELCIEVLSDNRTYDRVTKRFLYAEAGVQEYWLVEPSGLVERRTGSGLSESEEVTNRLTSLLLPGFELDLNMLRT